MALPRETFEPVKGVLRERILDGHSRTLNSVTSARAPRAEGGQPPDHNEQLPVQSLPLGVLICSDSPRVAGQDVEYVKSLAEVRHELPPIVVHCPTMRVIDGVHRLEAAKLRGDDEIAARLFDGDEAAAFVLAVRSNIEHGLPLTAADRSAAAVRILEFYPHWSDRAIGRLAGLAAGTVGRIRRRMTVPMGQSNARLGRDGRLRPLSTAEGRRQAAGLIREQPEASLREVARAAGISLATVQDVRRRLACGQDPVPAGQREVQPGTELPPRSPLRRSTGTRSRSPRPPTKLMGHLRQDPSLRFSESGRTILKLLSTLVAGTEGLSKTFSNAPPHSTVVVAELLRSLAREWDGFADRLVELTSVDGGSGAS